MQIGHDVDNKEKYYIGQAVDLYGRISNTQNHGIDNWEEILIFTTKDGQGLDDADINYIERQLITIAKDCNNELIENGNNGRKSSVNEELLGQLDDDIELIRIYCNILRCQAFVKRKIESSQHKESSDIEHIKFYCYRRESNAYMHIENGKYIVEKGSKISSHNIPVTLKSYQSVVNSRNKFKNKISEENILIEDIPFKSSSGASQFVVNYSSSGKEDWKDANGKTLKEYLDEENI